MNALVGEKLSITTHKAQTTRHRITGIVNGEDYQIVYSDTPGIVNPAYKLHDGMMQFIQEALQDADLVLYVVEAGERKIKNESIKKHLQQMEVPLLIAINKIDELENQEKLDEAFEFWRELFPEATIWPISALHKANLDKLKEHIVHHLPESPPYFPKDELTDKTMRFFVSEIIREKIFLHFKQEVPYSTEVEIEFFKENTQPVHIGAVIHVERDSQKGILIGKGGSMLKRIGIDSRKDIQDFIGKKIFLELFVKVNKDWKNKPRELRRFGYLSSKK